MIDIVTYTGKMLIFRLSLHRLEIPWRWLAHLGVEEGRGQTSCSCCTGWVGDHKRAFGQHHPDCNHHDGHPLYFWTAIRARAWDGQYTYGHDAPFTERVSSAIGNSLVNRTCVCKVDLWFARSTCFGTGQVNQPSPVPPAPIPGKSPAASLPGSPTSSRPTSPGPHGSSKPAASSGTRPFSQPTPSAESQDSKRERPDHLSMEQTEEQQLDPG